MIPPSFVELRHAKELRALVKKHGVTEVCRRSGLTYKAVRLAESKGGLSIDAHVKLIDFLLRERDVEQSR